MGDLTDNFHRREPVKLVAVLSIPRLGFNDFWGAALSVLTQRQVPLLRYTGAFWEQCLSRAMEQALETDATHILTLDYDTVFSGDDLDQLVTLAADHPHVDAIAPIQVARVKDLLLCSVTDDSGNTVNEVDRDLFAPKLTPVETAHFGCTLIRADALRALPKPWLHGQPASDGGWGDGRIDPDIYFWRQWRQAERTLYLANRVVVGHLELMIRWPDQDMRSIYQHPSDLKRSGPPADKWQ
jgi:hypothetical protein